MVFKSVVFILNHPIVITFQKKKRIQNSKNSLQSSIEMAEEIPKTTL